MAYYAALVLVVQSLKDITHHDRHPNTSLDKHQLLGSVYAKFNLLLERLDDYSPKDHKEESTDIERRIRDAAYRAQDVIEYHEKRVDKVRRHLDSTFQKPIESILETKYYLDLENVEAEVDSILKQLMMIKAESSTVHEDLQPNSYISVEASRVQVPSGNNTLVFNEGFRTTIEDQLCGQSSELEVISIAGMGGLGKTTLARNIFDGRLIHDRFDRRVWITVSQDYHLKNILLAIVSSLNINKEVLNGDGEEVLREYIYKKLFGRRFLIVMDDVWERKFWDDIRMTFPNNSNGSRIMITTRPSDVADYISSLKFVHQMPFLDEEQSWTLLRKKVFAAQEHFPKELENIGKSIAEKCRGLPLAIVVIAGVLSNVKKAQHDWENISRKVSSTAIDQNDEHLSTILSLSYYHLPHHLKPCFLYLGGYPEDKEIRISKLIRLWVAEGFLKPIESKSLEEVGEEYFRDLVNRNLVLITRKKSDGKFKFCIIHDVLRDLCSKRARDEKFLLCVRRKHDFKSVPIGDVRRVYIQTLDEYPRILKYIKKHGSNVRSLIYCSPEFCFEDNSLSAASGCRLLRILDARAILPNQSRGILARLHSDSGKIRKLLQLRYLDLQLFSIPVPPLIFHLQNLQTLMFRSHALLPFEIWKMPQLRHVMSKFGISLPPIPYDEVGNIDGAPLLGSLQTLSRVINFEFTSDTIEMIPSLKKLGFKCSYQCWEKYGLSNLVHLHQLETLYISFEDVKWDAMPLPGNFAFPSTLTKLTLFRCKLPWKDMSVVGSLPHLQVLKLRVNAFVGEEWKPIEGEFLKLKFLKMEFLEDLKYWLAEKTHFHCLEQLHIRECSKLEEVPSEIGNISTLQLIEIRACSSSLESSALKIQEEQRDLGNDDLQVRMPLLNETASRSAEAWAAVERSLNSRLQEAEAKAEASEEKERSINERLTQALSRINVLEAQISCLRAEQTQLSRSLEKERQRAVENRQEYLTLKEESDTHESHVEQLEIEIKELRKKHKEEMHEALMHQELLQKELEREKAARVDQERAASLQTSAVSDHSPRARQKPAAFENVT